MTGLKTTRLSKYRKVKLNNGLLNIILREKMPNDMYRLIYETDFYDRTFKECLELYLEEQETKEEPKKS